eukprot:6200010-Pleurochrysis_carterae.AAC.1
MEIQRRGRRRQRRVARRGGRAGEIGPRCARDCVEMECRLRDDRLKIARGSCESCGGGGTGRANAL